MFEKESSFGDIRKNVSKLAQNQTFWYLVCWLVGKAVFSETALWIFLIFCIKLGDHKGRQLTEPDIWKKYWFGDIRKNLPKLAQNQTLWYLVCWLVGNAVFSETALRIFLIFCMKLGDYKGRKVTEPDFWKKFLIWRYSRKRLQISPKSDTLIFGWLVGW